MDKKEIAERIRTLREAKGMTQNALAYQAGVSPTYIYQLERGEKNPTVEYLDHICWGLGITIEEFFTPKTKMNAKTLEDRISQLTSDQRRLLNAFLESLS